MADESIAINHLGVNELLDNPIEGSTFLGSETVFSRDRRYRPKLWEKEVVIINPNIPEWMIHFLREYARVQNEARKERPDYNNILGMHASVSKLIRRATHNMAWELHRKYRVLSYDWKPPGKIARRRRIDWVYGRPPTFYLYWRKTYRTAFQRARAITGVTVTEYMVIAIYNYIMKLKKELGDEDEI